MDTNNQDIKYQAIAEQQIAKVDFELSRNDWVLDTLVPGLIHRNNGVCPIPLYHVTTTSKKPVKQWIDRVWNVNEAVVKSDDVDAESWKILESGNNWRIVRQVNNLKWPIWQRELVFAQIRVDKEDASYLVMYSVQHPKAPLIPDTYVRAHMHTNVYGFKNQDGLTLASKTTQIDPAGLIPVSVVTKYTDKLTHMLNKINSEP